MSYVESFEEKTLDRVRVASRMRVANEAIRSSRLNVIADYTADALVAELTAFILTDKAGEQASAKTVIDRKVKPRWLPRWLWDRVFVEYVTLTVKADPQWTYPPANVALPELGSPVRYVVAKPLRERWDPNRSPEIRETF